MQPINGSPAARRTALTCLQSIRHHGRRLPLPRREFECRAAHSGTDEPPLVLGDVRVILVAPKGAVNVGAVCRACANFEATDLWVVAPRCDVREDQVRAVACGDAVLQRLRVASTLEEALAGAASSVGFTRRAGATRLVHPSIAVMLDAFPEAIGGMRRQRPPPPQPAPAPSSSGVTALVFGREESGLTEAELRLCAHACALPTGRLQPSMNLSHAAAVVLAQLFERRCSLQDTQDLGIERPAGAGEASSEAALPVSAAELEALLSKVARIAVAAGAPGEESRGGGAQGNHGRRRLALGHMRALLLRARATTWEVRSLHGLASAVLRQLGQAGQAGDGGGEPAGAGEHVAAGDGVAADTGAC